MKILDKIKEIFGFGGITRKQIESLGFVLDEEVDGSPFNSYSLNRISNCKALRFCLGTSCNNNLMTLSVRSENGVSKTLFYLIKIRNKRHLKQMLLDCYVTTEFIKK